MNDYEEELKVDPSVDPNKRAPSLGDDFEFDNQLDEDPFGQDGAFTQRAPHVPPVGASQEVIASQRKDRLNIVDDDAVSVIEKIPSIQQASESASKSASESNDGELVDHPDAQRARLWKERKRAMGFDRSKKGMLSNAVAGVGNVLTKVGAAGAQDSYTAGKGLGGFGSAAKATLDTTKDLAKIGKGVDAIAGLKGESSILNNNVGLPFGGLQIPGLTYKSIAESEFAPGIKAPDTVKAALTDGGTLLEVAGRGITAASGRRALDVGDTQRQKYMERRDAFTAARGDMRAKLQAGQRGDDPEALRSAVRQTQAARELGKAVSDSGVRPEYEYSMKESADINNMDIKRTHKARTTANPSRPGEQMHVAPGEVTFDRKAGTDALNAEPEYQTKKELKAGRRAKALAAPGEALEGLGRVIDGSEHGQEAVRKGEYLKGATQAALSGARTIGKGAAGVAAAPLGLGMATSALVDVGTVTVGGLLQAAGSGLNAVTGVGEKADKQRALELRNKHYFGKRNFLKSSPEPSGDKEPVAESEPGEEEKVPDDALAPKEQIAEPGAPENKEDFSQDPVFDTARGRQIAERGLRARDPLKEGDYEKNDRDAGLPQVDHGGAFKNFWHNRMKRPLQKVGQGLVKPLAMVTKGLGYLTGAIPIYNYFQNKKRKKAMEAATNRKNNRQGVQVPSDDFELVDRPDEKQADAQQADAPKPAAVPQYAGGEEQDKVLQSLEGRKADAQINRVELRRVLDEQNKSYESSTVSRGAKAALKMAGRDLTKENVAAWQNFERRHNETRLAQKIADRKRERAKNPATGESFLEKQKREYLEWYDKKKRFDHYADADTGNVMQRLAATDPHAQPKVPDQANAGIDMGQEIDLDQGFDQGEDKVSDGNSSRGSLQLSDDGSQGQESILDNPSDHDEKVDMAEERKEAPPVNAPPVNAPPVNAPPVNAPPVNAAPVNAPPLNSPFSLQAMPATPITQATPKAQTVPFGFTPEAYAEDRREWEKMLRKRA